MYAIGQELVCGVKVVKCIDTQKRLEALFQHQMPGLWDHVHINIVGPLPPSDGQTYMLTCIDRFPRWPEAIPLSDITAETGARVFMTRQVANFGVPSTVSTDRGRQFESSLFQTLTEMLGFKRIRTTSYHPSSHGMVECFRLLKAGLKAHVNTQ